MHIRMHFNYLKKWGAPFGEGHRKRPNIFFIILWAPKTSSILGGFGAQLAGSESPSKSSMLGGFGA